MKIKTIDKDLKKFIKKLESNTRAKVLRTINLLELFGYALDMPHSKKISIKLFELRIHGKQKIRIFYTFHKESIILLHGFLKKSPKIPQKELKIAVKKLSLLDNI